MEVDWKVDPGTEIRRARYKGFDLVVEPHPTMPGWAWRVGSAEGHAENPAAAKTFAQAQVEYWLWSDPSVPDSELLFG